MKRLILLFLTSISCILLSAQTAKSVLDKTAALCSKGAVKIEFTAKSKEGTSSGTLITQNNRFTLKSPEANIWFDGKTEWSMVNGSGEVNVITPTAKEIAEMNPMNFINLYKKGYKMSMKTVNGNQEIHLIATSKKQSIQEMYIYINPKTSKPKTIKFRSGKAWTNITVRSFTQLGQKNPLSFAFNPKDYPGVNIIDMR